VDVDIFTGFEITVPIIISTYNYQFSDLLVAPFSARAASSAVRVVVQKTLITSSQAGIGSDLDHQLTEPIEMLFEPFVPFL